MYNDAVNIAGIQYVLLDKSSLVNTCHLSSVLKVGFFFFFCFCFLVLFYKWQMQALAESDIFFSWLLRANWKFVSSPSLIKNSK